MRIHLSLVRDSETFRSKTTSPTPNAMAKMVMMLLSILKIHFSRRAERKKGTLTRQREPSECRSARTTCNESNMSRSVTV
eukprot:1319633-Amorphochlora_amoeboformis.AAC.1